MPLAAFAAIAGAAVGSIITFVGVLVQNLFENWRNRTRLKHDANQRDQERRMKVRCETFIETAQELVRAIRYIATFGDLQQSDKEHSKLIEGFGPALARLHLIASKQTILKALEVNECFAGASLKLTQLSISVKEKRANLEYLDKEIGQDIALQQNIVNRLNQLQTNPTAQSEIVGLGNMYRDLGIKIDVARAKSQALAEQLTREHFDLIRASERSSMEFTNKLVELNIEIRKEFDFALGHEEASYQAAVLESFNRTSQQTEQFLNAVENMRGVKREA